MGNIKIGPQWSSDHHRSGWAYVTDALQHLHSDNGVRFDSFIDHKFALAGDDGWPPYREPWIGIFHNPPYVPPWFGLRRSAGDIITSLLWRKSLPYCRGLYTLSNYLADWLRPRVRPPVCSLFHPTSPCDEQFSMEKYYNNKNRCVIHIGWWLRKFHSFFLLRTRYLQKLLIAPIPSNELPSHRQEIKLLLLTERNIAKQKLIGNSVIQPFKFEFHKDNDSYDRLLSSNIVFIDLYDSSANNVIVECIVRNTPLIINRHPAAVEYLGQEYPLFFDTAEEASDMVENDQQLYAAHKYLCDHHEIKKRLTREWFIREFTNSTIYRQLSQ